MKEKKRKKINNHVLHMEQKKTMTSSCHVTAEPRARKDSMVPPTDKQVVQRTVDSSATTWSLPQGFEPLDSGPALDVCQSPPRGNRGPSGHCGRGWGGHQRWRLASASCYRCVCSPGSTERNNKAVSSKIFYTKTKQPFSLPIKN